ncbi:hypothetical protein F5883DRAFT_105901 [Diaporthe sp. PMI_573]|nr:hypothetical protein F5883DRAFT_105901 [Diaporthaceae sp. PMI_573]
MHSMYLDPSSSQASSRLVLLLLLLLLLHSCAFVLDMLNSRPANGSSKNWDGLRISHDVFDSSAVLRPAKLDPWMMMLSCPSLKASGEGP